MFQKLLEEYLDSPARYRQEGPIMSIMDALYDFVDFLDTRGLTLHEAESGSGQSTIQTSEPATPDSNAN